MSATDNTAPVIANAATGAVVADLSDIGEIPPAPTSVTGVLWVALVIVLGIVVVSADAALIVGFLLGRVTAETILLVFTTTSAALIGLFIQRPGAH